MEIATVDNGNKPIYVIQYSYNSFTKITRTLTLLDGSGNTSIPGVNFASFGGSRILDTFGLVVEGSLSTPDIWDKQNFKLFFFRKRLLPSKKQYFYANTQLMS